VHAGRLMPSLALPQFLHRRRGMISSPWWGESGLLAVVLRRATVRAAVLVSTDLCPLLSVGGGGSIWHGVSAIKCFQQECCALGSEISVMNRSGVAISYVFSPRKGQECGMVVN
jgi:hypothetical protein